MSYPEQYKAALLEPSSKSISRGWIEAIEWFREARDSSRRIFVCGNGGSASTASHFTCDMVKGASHNRDVTLSHSVADRFAPHAHRVFQ